MIAIKADLGLERFARVLKEGVLMVAGLLGLLAIVWLASAMFFNLSIVVFKTGSMAPAIPIGSAAIVREVAASELKPGDVVTVRRAGAALPITHRVVSIEIDPVDSAGRIVTLRGDANASNDLSPYSITEAQRVIVSFAGWGAILGLLGSPFFLAVTTLLVALLIMWAFWPQRLQRRLDRSEEASS